MEWVWGLIGAVLAAGALGFVIRDYLEQLQQVPDVSWSLDGFGTASGPDGTMYQIVELTNGGRSTARITAIAFVNCRVFQTPEYRLRWHHPPATSIQLLIESESLLEAWVVIVFTHARKSRRIFVEWRPLVADGDLAEERARQVDSISRWRAWWARRGVPYPVKPVGPGSDGFPRVRVAPGKDVPGAMVNALSLQRDNRGHLVGPGLKVSMLGTPTSSGS